MCVAEVNNIFKRKRNRYNSATALDEMCSLLLLS